MKRNPKPTEAEIKATQQKRYAKRRKYTGAAAVPAQKNPKGRVIYGRVIQIRAQKTQVHICDAGCKRAGHKYYHNFKPGAKAIGLPNGDVLITSR